jgi:hypothetical protein
MDALIDVQAVAAEAFATLDTGSQIRPFSSRICSFDLSLVGLADPRVEPEIVFKLAVAPTPGMDEGALLESIDWVAHGFEIVQSIFP